MIIAIEVVSKNYKDQYVSLSTDTSEKKEGLVNIRIGSNTFYDFSINELEDALYNIQSSLLRSLRNEK